MKDARAHGFAPRSLLAMKRRGRGFGSAIRISYFTMVWVMTVWFSTVRFMTVMTVWFYDNGRWQAKARKHSYAEDDSTRSIRVS